jgi:predicted MFS family arabinose efflux permease
MTTSYWQRVRMIGRDAWIVIAGYAAFGFTWTGVSGAILNLFYLRMGYGPQFVGLATGVTGLSFALAALPAAIISRWMGERRAMIVGSIGWVVGMVAVSTADLLPGSWRQPWILGTGVLGISVASLYLVSSLPFLTSITTVEERPHAFAFYWALSPLAAGLGGVVGGLLPGFLAGLTGTSVGQPRPYGYALALGMLVYAPLLWALFALREGQPQGRRTETRGKGGAVPYVVLGVIGLICLLRVGGEFTARTFFNVYLDSAWSVSTARIGAAVAVASLLTIPAPLVTPLLVGRLGRVGTVVIGALGVAGSLVLLAFGGHWLIAAVAYVSLSALAAMARSVWTLLTQEAVKPAWRSTSAGVSNLASGLGLAVMSSAGGLMVTGLGYGFTFVTGAVLVALGALVLWLYFRVPRAHAAVAGD